MESEIFQLKVTLAGLRPRIWRRFLVPSRSSFETLHHTLQFVMGWQSSHLYTFTVDFEDIGDPELGDVRNAKRTKLADCRLTKGERFIYEYDMGDSWQHNIVVERVFVDDDDSKYPQCLAGARACPPEDCGGIWGYRDLLKALANPRHPDHEEMVEWVGGPFDPERFSSTDVNSDLANARFFRPRSPRTSRKPV